jgi:hypothetical protein
MLITLEKQDVHRNCEYTVTLSCGTADCKLAPLNFIEGGRLEHGFVKALYG